MARLAATKRTTWSLVSHYAQVVDLDGKRLVLQFDSPGRAASFMKGAHQEFLRQALIDVLGMDCTFDAVADQTRPTPAAVSPAAASPAVSAAASPHASAAVPASAPTEGPPSAGAPESPAGSTEPPPTGPRHPAAQAARASSRAPARPPAEDDIPLPPEPPPDDLPPEEGPPAPAPPRQPAPTIRLADDVPSVDDIDLEGSGLVGASVVEQLLGGRVIEERHD
jgi:DNA polymerase-3 subunit gamma/tau